MLGTLRRATMLGSVAVWRLRVRSAMASVCRLKVGGES